MNAEVAELADAHDSKSCPVYQGEGSTPSFGTTTKQDVFSESQFVGSTQRRPLVLGLEISSARYTHTRLWCDITFLFQKFSVKQVQA